MIGCQPYQLFQYSLFLSTKEDPIQFFPDIRIVGTLRVRAVVLPILLNECSIQLVIEVDLFDN